MERVAPGTTPCLQTAEVVLERYLDAIASVVRCQGGVSVCSHARVVVCLRKQLRKEYRIDTCI